MATNEAAVPAVEDLSFEAALAELEDIVSRLEQGEVDLEDSIALYERGTALKAPAKIAGMVAGLLPPATRWKLFFKREAANPRYLHDGDVITATIASPDGDLDLGTQRNTVIGKTP